MELIVKEHNTKSSNQKFTLNEETTFAIIGEPTERLVEIINLMAAEMHNRDVAKVKMPLTDIQAKNQIQVEIVNVNQITSASESQEAYKLIINENGAVVQGASEQAVFYGLRTLEHLLLINPEIDFGEWIDYPDTEIRKFHVDAARKYFSKSWFIEFIHQMSAARLNALQFHFSENLGFRIECETDPSIVSKDHLTKAEVREIIEEARLYGIEVIPSFDSPGHLDQILKSHPEFGQKGVNGAQWKEGLDITNPEAIEYLRSLYLEYFELFKDSRQFHIGGDEYMAFDQEPFLSTYRPILNEYAQRKYGPDYNWQDTVAGYINDLAEFTKQHGFEPIVWNDGLYYNENETQIETAQKQKIQMHDYISVDYWSHMPWNPAVGKVEELMAKGFNKIYNFNADYMYYVLRNDMPDNEYNQHSFWLKDTEEKIWNEFSLGMFPGTKIPDDDPVIKGAGMAIWCDKPSVTGEYQVMMDVVPVMFDFGMKMWDTKVNEKSSYEEYKIVKNRIN